jgi:2-aminoethylphosphonate-pyruvate transaminase
LVIINGAYGDRILEIARRHGIETIALRYDENIQPNPADVEEALRGQPDVEQVAIVHCETTSGIMNPIEPIGRIAHRHGKRYFVDSMSAFGAVPFDFARCGIDYLVSSSNKCLEGVPGFAFVICRRNALLETDGWARTVSLDLLAQWQGLERNGQFRFTPPTHAILAFGQALDELDQEGGVAGRAERYRRNYQCIVEGMREMGFREYVPAQRQGYIITSFHYPDDPSFDFARFYDALSDRGCLIYPGKVTKADCFRIGNIGRLNIEHMRALLKAIHQVLTELGIQLDRRPVTP